MSRRRPLPADASVRYAHSGFHVLPLVPGEKRPLTALVPRAAKDASTNVETVAAWWAHEPRANVGLVGSARLAALDIDVKDGRDGWAVLAELEAEHGALPDTRRVLTPSGGAHLWFQPNGTRPHNFDRAGLELRARTRYVVAPPSVVDGERYRFDCDAARAIASLPPWLAELGAWDRTEVIGVHGHEQVPARRVQALKRERTVRAALKASKFGGDSSERDYALAREVRAAGGTPAEAAAVICDVRGDDPKARRPDYLRRTVSRAWASPQGDAMPAAQGGRRLAVVRASDVEPEPVRFLWRPYIPLGALTLLAGKGGLGKSTLTSSIGADLTRGDLSGNLSGKPATVLVASAEDSESNTLRPRFEMAGADLDRVGFVQVSYANDDGGLGLLSVSDDLDMLADAVKTMRARLLVLDPLVSFLDGIDAHKDQQIRRVLAPLAQLAKEHRVAVLAVIHLNKGTQYTDFMSRLSGSVAFGNTARSVLGLGDDLDGRLTLVHAKANLSVEGESLSCHVEQVSYRHKRRRIYTSKFVIDGTSDVRADELASPASTADERTAKDEAAAFLQDVLADGPVPSLDAIDHVRKQAGCSEKTVRRAQKALGIQPEQQWTGTRSYWLWSLPEREAGQ